MGELRTQEEETQNKDVGMENQGRRNAEQRCGNGEPRKKERRTKMWEWRTKEEGTQNKDEGMENQGRRNTEQRCGNGEPRKKEWTTHEEGKQNTDLMKRENRTQIS